MRTLVLPLLAALIALTAVAWSARAEGEKDSAARIATLEAQVASLRADVDLMASRGAVVTRCLLSFSQAAANLKAGTGRSRQAGFEEAAITPDSRILLLRTLEQLAQDFSAALPKPAADDAQLQRRAEELHKAATEGK